MATVKGVNLCHVRDFIKERKLEQSLLAKLSPDHAKIFSEAMHGSLIPLDAQAVIYRAAASLLFPGVQNGCVEIGKMLGKKSFGGVYKVFLLIPSPQYVIGKATRIWSTYYDKGEAAVTSSTDKGLEFVVKNFAELPAEVRDSVTGNISILMEYAGCKNLVIKHDSSDPQVWRWTLTWS